MPTGFVDFISYVALKCVLSNDQNLGGKINNASLCARKEGEH